MDRASGARRRAQRLRRGDLPRVGRRRDLHLRRHFPRRSRKRCASRPTPSFPRSHERPCSRLGGRRRRRGRRRTSQSCARRSPHCATRTVARARRALLEALAFDTSPHRLSDEEIVYETFHSTFVSLGGFRCWVVNYLMELLLHPEEMEAVVAEVTAGRCCSDFASQDGCVRATMGVHETKRTHSCLTNVPGRARRPFTRSASRSPRAAVLALSFTNSDPIWGADAHEWKPSGWQPTAARRRTRTAAERAVGGAAKYGLRARRERPARPVQSAALSGRGAEHPRDQAHLRRGARPLRAAARRGAGPERVQRYRPARADLRPPRPPARARVISAVRCTGVACYSLRKLSAR